ncbi:DNA transposition protein [Varunaivibrio sulfuroxidans]|uniref:Uncharacterized protein n=1 Tax=Varunaivibrio sulfuroxidans TaxID=1773489 RepID=A0A4R3JBT1_9PROT|nr:DNA transposition protein [Varunaivibrio sulfuroxidans]TCS62556.1 hypothetical protein EDD55_105102 [Varunaivibrio sulfuroxidans]WES30774.1 DNA transposition protein [Varunaivibrio sulfuroxidans]
MTRRDGLTLDLLSWEPPTLIERFDDARVRTATLRSRIARAVAETLKGSDIPRADIAAAMSDWLGEDVSKAMLDAYASEAREDHTIPFLRLLAMVHVTGDVRLLQMGAELFAHSVVDDKYLPWVEVGQLADRKEDIDKAFEYARRSARRGVKR